MLARDPTKTHILIQGGHFHWPETAIITHQSTNRGELVFRVCR